VVVLGVSEGVREEIKVSSGQFLGYQTPLQVSMASLWGEKTNLSGPG